MAKVNRETHDNWDAADQEVCGSRPSQIETNNIETPDVSHLYAALRIITSLYQWRVKGQSYTNPNGVELWVPKSEMQIKSS